MIDIRTIDNLAQRLAALVPPGLNAAQDDLTRTFKTALQSGLSRMNLVTREEFDVQRLVLLRTREKAEMLEKQLAKLEAMLTQSAADSDR
jgi:BMFP domain-containing protein YqiC